MANKTVLKSVQFIESHLTEELNVSEIARYAGYSEFHFSRLFHAEMQCSVMEYVRKRKLYKASESILEGAKIIDAAYEYGWRSHNSFTRAFKAEYGVCPSLLRAMHLSMQESRGRRMEHWNLKHVKEDVTKEEVYAILQETLSENAIRYDDRQLSHMYHVCCQVYGGLKRYSGSEYVTHPLNVAVILADLGEEENVIYAGMFCDVRRKIPDKEELLAEQLPADVWELVKAVNECERMDETSDEDVLFIKLAERLHNMRTISYMDEEKIHQKVQETFHLFLPVARKLGNEKLAAELNDLTVGRLEKDGK